MDRYGMGEAHNENWEKDWKDIVETDQHYDSDYLIRLVVHKLGLMLDYFKSTELQVDPEIIDSIDTCYNLGLKILTFNYGVEADKIFNEKGSANWLVESSEEDDYMLWNDLSDKAEISRNEDIERFFNKIGKHAFSWWV